ncbi:MAG: hypothetical protein WC744_00735 [Patescibacteria group bacterium]|jgi:hypothetical protein
MDKKFVALMILFFVVFGIFITTTFFNKQLASLARASADSDPSPKESLFFYYPIEGIKPGVKVDINIFVRNNNKMPLNNKPIKLITNFGLINGLKESVLTSDTKGKVSFVLTSEAPGSAELTAYFKDNIVLIKKVIVFE